MNTADFIAHKLAGRVADNSLRKLIVRKGFSDFCSNDYLGISTLNLTAAADQSILHHGSGGARTLAGNYEAIMELEEELARFHQAEAGLIFNSGYTANLGLMSCLPQRGDTILYDYLSHASLRDGIRLSLADAHSFQHNDVEDLGKKLKMAKGNVFVVTESLFSMDGDFAPLNEISEICERYNASLVVDEAHATGVVGNKGEGLVQSLGLQGKVFARVHTFGKAVGVHGAVVLGSSSLKQYLINFCRSFIFTTALPENTIQCINKAYALFPSMYKEREHLGDLIRMFQQAAIKYEKLSSLSPIQGVIVPGNDEVKSLASLLTGHNLDVRPILYPTVPKGKERLRISLHAFNTREELQQLIDLIS